MFIMRVGDIEKNFQRSVLDRLTTGNGAPVWGYNSLKCAGFTSKYVHRYIMQTIEDHGHIYAFFKPSKRSPVVVVAKRTKIYKRDMQSLEESNRKKGG